MLVGGFIFTALLLFYVGYLVRCAWHWGRLRANASADEPLPRVSVIIPARNEAANIEACLNAVFAQDYPADALEVIVVNDHSEDATAGIAVAVARNHLGADAVSFAHPIGENVSGGGSSSVGGRFRLLNLDAQTGPAYKKAAVAFGIRQSRGEIIVTTDADCTMGPGWLRAMVGGFSEETGLVSGPVELASWDGFTQMQALEFMGLIAVGAASIAAGSPTMCNGANLAYRRRAYDEVGGFSGIDHIASGDDELLMHKIAAQGHWKVAFMKRKVAIVRTPAQGTWAEFKAQRIRWVSKSGQYKRRGITAILVLSYLAVLGFPVLAVAGIWEHRLWWLMLGHLALKIVAEAAVLVPAARFFDKLRLLPWLPVEQVAHIAYVLWVGIAGQRKSYQWKGRTVK
ncbi:MAG: glycosyltransferase [Bacteroidia bacterium]